MATLREQIENVFSNESRLTAIECGLRELGISAREIDILLSTHNAVERDAITFGVEIECYNVDREEIAQRLREAGIKCYAEGYNHRDCRDHFKVVTDASLMGNSTAEVVSPILKGKKGMNALEKVCKVLNEINAKVNKSCGLHVHFGLSSIDFDTYKRIIVNYANIESVIDSFMPASRRENRFCKSLRGVSINRIKNAESYGDVSSAFSNDRYYKVNATSYGRHNTIEFRQHSGTVEFAKMANWIIFLRSLIEYSKQNTIGQSATIASLPFLKAEQKSFYELRQRALA